MGAGVAAWDLSLIHIFKIELLFALGAAEVICPTFVLGSARGGSRFYIHAADRIFHCCCAIHFELSFVPYRA